MRYTIKTEAGPVTVEARAGRVVVNGQAMLPFEADIFGQALTEAAEHAEALAAKYAAKYIAKSAAEAS